MINISLMLTRLGKPFFFHFCSSFFGRNKHRIVLKIAKYGNKEKANQIKTLILKKKEAKIK